MRTLSDRSSGLVPPLVYLTGFMGSGKSTVGPLVADALGYRFVDLDWLVEARAGQSVADLVEQYQLHLEEIFFKVIGTEAEAGN